jgi:hypothetical protein
MKMNKFGTYETVEESWKMWKEIVCDANGNINFEQLKKELFDYCNVMDSASIINCAVSGGALSYPNYPAQTVLSLFEDKFLNKEIVKDDILDIVKGRVDHDVLRDLQDYLK